MNSSPETEDVEPVETSSLPRLRGSGALQAHVQYIQNRAGERPPTIRERLSSRIMYLECKAGDLTGEARIGRVRFSRTGGTLYYGVQRFQSLKGAGFKSNYFDVDTGDDHWISGPRRDGADRLYGERVPVKIDEDVREEYWREIRGLPECVARKET